LTILQLKIEAIYMHFLLLAGAEYVCYSDWHSIPGEYGSNQPPLCVKKSHLWASWSQALASCRDYGAHLLVADESFYAGKSSTTAEKISLGFNSYIVQYPGGYCNWHMTE
jgi:hypothetical protein